MAARRLNRPVEVDRYPIEAILLEALTHAIPHRVAKPLRALVVDAPEGARHGRLGGQAFESDDTPNQRILSVAGDVRESAEARRPVYDDQQNDAPRRVLAVVADGVTKTTAKPERGEQSVEERET